MPDAPRTQPQCTGRTKAGARCRARALPGGKYCVSHDPAKVTELAEWRRQGGYASSNAARAKRALPAAPLSTLQMRAYLSKVFVELIAGDIAPNVATASAAVVRTLAELHRLDEIEGRIAALEAMQEGSQA
jgi:hypothetical protein